MMSLIEVRCPHCGVKGRIMAPPLGTIIFGPCPECQEMVTIFCGQVLPLDKEIMTKGGDEEKKEHLLETLGLFLQDRIEQMFRPPDGVAPSESAACPESVDEKSEELQDSEIEPDSEEETMRPTFLQSHHRTVISEDELDTFRNIELKLIDNKEYFRAVFR